MRTLLWAALLLATLASIAVLQADRTASWFLSRHCHADVRVHGVGWDGWGGFSAESFEAAPAGGREDWLRGGRTHVRFPSFPNLDSARMQVVQLEAGGALRSRVKKYVSWLGDAEFFAGPGFDRVLLAATRRGEAWQIRVIEARSGHFAAAGGARLEGGRLVKLDARWSVSEPLFSRWPEAVTKRMIPAPNGWRAAGVAFGGTTWTLRGYSGPLLQFSGTMTA